MEGTCRWNARAIMGMDHGARHTTASNRRGKGKYAERAELCHSSQSSELLRCIPYVWIPAVLSEMGNEGFAHECIRARKSGSRKRTYCGG